jgi:hypothetical protein
MGMIVIDWVVWGAAVRGVYRAGKRTLSHGARRDVVGTINHVFLKLPMRSELESGGLPRVCRRWRTVCHCHPWGVSPCALVRPLWDAAPSLGDGGGGGGQRARRRLLWYGHRGARC